MFSAFCPRHRSNVLLSLDDIGALRRDDTGIHIRFTCQCGYSGWHHPTGPTE